MSPSTKQMLQTVLLFVFIAGVHSSQTLYTGPRRTFTPQATRTVTPTNRCFYLCSYKSLKRNQMLCAQCIRGVTLKDLGQPSSRPVVTWKKETKFQKITTTRKPERTTLSKNYERLCMECLQSSQHAKRCQDICKAWLNGKTTPTMLRPLGNANGNGKVESKPTPRTRPSESELKVTRSAEENLLSTLLEYKEREFWFVAFALGCVILLLLLIVIMLLSRRRRTQKMVKPRMDFSNI